MNARKYIAIIGLSIAVTIAVIGSAAAQEGDEEATPDGNPNFTVMNEGIWSSSTTSTTTTMVAGLGLLSLQLASPDDDQVEAYLRENAVAVQYDLHLGAGHTARDLAALLVIDEDHLAAFAQLLYDRRKALASLVEPGGVDAASAREFTTIIIDEMLGHEQLHESAHRLIASRDHLHSS